MASLDLDTVGVTNCSRTVVQILQVFKLRFGVQVHRSDHFNNKKILRRYIRVVTSAFIGHPTVLGGERKTVSI